MNAQFEFGKYVGAALMGKSASDVRFTEGAVAVLDSAEAAPLHHAMCKIAADAYVATGDTRSAPSLVFQRLASEPWDPRSKVFADCVSRALSKQASMLPLLAATHDKLGGKLLRTLVAAGVLGGAGAGGLGFLLSRNARQSSAENEEILEKVRAYKQLTRDIEEDMSMQNVMPANSGGAGGRYDV